MNEPAEKAGRLPPWLRGARIVDPGGHGTRSTLRRHGVHTVCEEARCPNRGECFSRRTATFLILGDRCTRRCGFCAVDRSSPPARPEAAEPENVARAAGEMGLEFVVVTSVTRDDLPDGGARQFAETIRALHGLPSRPLVEVLVPDFGGDPAAVDEVLAAGPDVFNHNVETVPRLYATVRPEAVYRRSLDVLRRAAESGRPRFVKSGLMVGLGESREELSAVMSDLLDAGCRVLTIGQYLRPTKNSLPVVRYVEPAEFDSFAEEGRRLGFAAVFSGPLIRSSYLAHNLFLELKGAAGGC